MENLKKQVRDLIEISKKLGAKYPPKKFTLDGRIVGDIGETIVSKHYKITLFQKVVKHIDGYVEGTSPVKNVQIKATMQSKGSINYPSFHHPQMLLAIKIKEDGSFTELFNGPTRCFKEVIDRRKKTPNTSSIIIGEKELLQLNDGIKDKDRIPKR